MRSATGKDLDLYEEVFQSAGVSEDQFLTLLRHGQRCRAGEGSVIVQAGQSFPKVALVISGRARAYRPPENPEHGFHDVVCEYVGKLDLSDVVGSTEPMIAPVRGCVIGGSALVDTELAGQEYPTQIIASTDIEWIEWSLEDLLSIIHAQKMKALQAAFYQLLYVELIDTLKRDRKVRESPRKVGGGHLPVAQPPTTKQLLSLSAFVAVPFFGFGVADNGIMIICGDLIDAQFGTVLGLSTMAAAGLGNWVSDTIGLGIGDAIERSAGRFGLSNGNLSPAQERMPSAKKVTLVAKIVGITLGCFAGMTPLLFLTPSKKEFANEDLEVFDEVFAQTGMTLSHFSDLIDKASRHHAHAGQVVVEGGKPLRKLILLLHGEACEVDPDGKTQTAYIGRMGAPPRSAAGDRQAGAPRSSLIGAKGFVDEAYVAKPFPNNVVASTHLEWMEWDLDELEELTESKVAIRGSFVSLLYTEVIAKVNADKAGQSSRQYRELLAAVTADGYIDDKERTLLLQHKKDLRITDEEHNEILADLGWSVEAWDRGTITSIPGHHHLEDASHEDLVKAAALLEQIARSMRAS